MRREKRIAAAKAFPSRGRWHCEAMTDEVGRGALLQPCGNAVRQSTQHSRGVMATRSCHLISRLGREQHLCRQKPPPRGAAKSNSFAEKAATPPPSHLKAQPHFTQKSPPHGQGERERPVERVETGNERKGKAQAAALFRRLSSALASSRAHTPLIRSGITKGVTHQARLVARSLPDMNMNQAVPKV